MSLQMFFPLTFTNIWMPYPHSFIVRFTSLWDAGVSVWSDLLVTWLRSRCRFISAELPHRHSSVSFWLFLPFRSSPFLFLVRQKSTDRPLKPRGLRWLGQLRWLCFQLCCQVCSPGSFSATSSLVMSTLPGAAASGWSKLNRFECFTKPVCQEFLRGNMNGVILVSLTS